VADDVDYDALASSLFPQPKGKPDTSPAGPAPGDTDYDKVLRDLTAGQAGANLRAVQGLNPDQAARAQALSRASGLPLPAVEGAEDQVEGEVRRQAAEAALQGAPRVQMFFSNPDFAKVAHDDAETLSWLERTWSKIRDTAVEEAEGAAKGFRRGMITTDLRDVGRRLFWGQATPEDEARVGELEKAQEQLETDAYLSAAGEQIPIMGSILGKALQRGLQTGIAFGGGAALLGQLGPQAALPEELVTVPAATATGLAVGGRAGALEAAWELETYLAFIEYRGLKTSDGRPLDNDVARGAAMLAGTVNAGLEAYGLSAILKRVPGIAELAQLGGRKKVAAAIGQAAATSPSFAATLATFGKRYAEGIAIESLTEMLQELSTASFAEVAKMADGGAFKGAGLEDTVERVIDAGVQAAKATSVLGLPGPAMQAMAERRRATKAARDAEAIREAGDAADLSKLAQRDPERFGEVTGAVLRDQGVDTIAIPAARLQEFFQGAPEGGEQAVDQATLMRNLGVTDEQMAEALAVGGDVHMTPEAFAQHILTNKATRAGLTEHVRLGVDGMTEAEAKEWEATGLRESIDDMASLLDSMESGRRVEAARIETEVERMMMAAGEARDTARYAAVLTAQRYAVRAERAGVSPLELWQQDNLRIERVRDMGRRVDEIDIILDKARSPDTLRLPKTPILDLLARTGVDPNSPLAGELKALGVTAKTRPGLFKVGGRQAADNLPLAEMPWFTADEDDGTGNYVSEAAILAAVRDELAGNPRRTADEQTRLDGRENDIRNLEADIERYNEMSGNALSIVTSSAAEIRDALQELADLEARAVQGNVMEQTVPLRGKRETLKRFGLEPGKKYKTREVAAALEARQRQKYGTIEADDRSPEAERRLASWMVEEILFEVEQAKANPEKSPVGWYSIKFQKALDRLGAAFPELVDDTARTTGDAPPGVKLLPSRDAARTLLTALIAVTSDGAKVKENLRFAAIAYEAFRQTGSFDFEFKLGGERNSSMVRNIQRIARLAQDGGFDQLRTMLLAEAKVGELKRMAEKAGVSFSTGYTVDTTMPVSASVFGPKLGAFFANLMGSTGYLTMDRWWSRTFNRYRGTLLTKPTEAGLQRFKELVTKDRRLNQPVEMMTDDEALALTVDYVASYKAKGFKEGTEIEKAANTLYKAAFEQLEDQPFNATDRTFMIATTMRAQKMLARRGVDLTVADIQAVLWYYEKRLYGQMGARQTADISYEDIARATADAIIASRQVSDGGQQRSDGAGLGDERGSAGRLDVAAEPALQEVDIADEDFLGGDEGAQTLEQSGAPLERGVFADVEDQLDALAQDIDGIRDGEFDPAAARKVLDKLSNADRDDPRARMLDRALLWLDGQIDTDQDAVAEEIATVIEQARQVGEMRAGMSAAAGRGTLEQPARGSIQFNPGQIIIRLGAGADRSTFLHESGHLYLEQLRADAAAYGAGRPQLAQDLQTVNDWFASNAGAIRQEAIAYARKAGDAVSVTTLEAMTDDQVEAMAKAGGLAGMPRGAKWSGHLARAAHEQWARGTEDYFRTGLAPSVALQDAFNRFRAWLVSIYAALQRRLGSEQLAVRFSPEVKSVMDRMLATDEEIALVEQQYNLRAMFASPEEASMSPERFAAYQAAVMAAGEAARTEQLRRHMREVEREKAAWWREERAKLREEVAAEVRARPVFLAIHALAAGKMPDGQPLPAGLVQPRMSREAVVALLENQKSLSRLPRVKGRTVYATAQGESGSHPDVVASFYGFDSGRDMLIAMMNTNGVETTIDRETDERMRERHGDMQVDGTAVDKAVESAHTDKRGDVLIAELNALQSGGGTKLKPAFLRQWARERIAGRKVSELQPQRFLMAERKAGRAADRALASGDRTEALKAKFQQALNFYMAHEAYKARAEVEKAVDYLSGFTRAAAKFPALEAGYVDQIRTILDAYQLGPQLMERTRVRLEMQAVLDWIERQRQDAGATIEMPQRIIDADERTNYQALTLDEFRTLRDTIKNLEAQGRLAKTALIDGEEFAISEMANDIAASAERNPQLPRMARRAVEQKPGVLDRARSKLASFDAALRKVELLVEQVDGQRMGPLWRFLFKPFADAETARKDMTLRVTQRVMDALDNMPTRSRLAERITVPLLGRTFARSDLIMMALNVGNESNFEKMIEGSEKDVTDGATPFTVAGVDEALANLTAEEWTFVQEVWDAFEAMWPQVREVYRRENGVAPERVDARTIETRYGQSLRGGYFPMMYDPARSVQARDIEGKTALEAMQSTVVRASVNSSMTKARTGFSAPVLLDITALPNHIERTAHFITHYEPVRIARKLLARQRVVRALNNRVGPELYDTLKAWVQELAANGQPVAPTSIGGRLVEAMRRNATVAIMGLSYTTMVAQVFGLANSIDALSRAPGGGYSPRRGTTAMLVGLVRYLASPAQVRAQVFAASGEMRHRLQNTDRDIRHALQQLSGKRGAWSQMQRFSLMGIAGIQLYMVDLPTWLAAYDQAIARGATTDEAVDAADNILRTSQTAGGIKDLAAIQRERGVMTALTMFYSYFNLLYNLQRQALGNVRGVRDVPQLAARAFILMAVPVMVDALVKRQGPDEDKEETLAGFLAAKAAVYAMSSLPFLRDLAGLAEGFGYKPTPLDGFGKALGASVKGIAEAIDNGELDAKALKALVSALGFGAGVPATQVNRVISAADAMFEGEDVGVYDFLAGPKKDK
jgi:hypothetical protein